MIALETWRRRGRRMRTPAGEVFVLQAGDEHGGTPVLCLHGFPTASWDFAEVVERLSRRRRVITFDFLGYGFSDKPREHAYSLFEQADLVLAVAREFGLSRVHLVAHDMGTSVACELAARREWGSLPLALESLVLMNGSVHIELAHLTPGQKLLRSPLGSLFAAASTRFTFGVQIKQICARKPTEDELDAMWELVSRDDGAARMPALIGYIDERWKFHDRWIGALERLDVPTLVAWGERDPVAVLAIAHALAREIPGARLRTFSDLGHWPQLEDPARVAQTLEAFWDEVPARHVVRAP